MAFFKGLIMAKAKMAEKAKKTRRCRLCKAERELIGCVKCGRDQVITGQAGQRCRLCGAKLPIGKAMKAQELTTLTAEVIAAECPEIYEAIKTESKAAGEMITRNLIEDLVEACGENYELAVNCFLLGKTDIELIREELAAMATEQTREEGTGEGEGEQGQGE